VRNALLGHGVIARPVGPSVLAFCPPLVVSESQMDRCVEGTGLAVAAVLEHGTPA
jgi:adenosylmethionine-8-amino-7-oxononanoate aminotransferase